MPDAKPLKLVKLPSGHLFIPAGVYTAVIPAEPEETARRTPQHAGLDEDEPHNRL